MPWAVAALFAATTALALWAPWRPLPAEDPSISLEIYPPSGSVFDGSPLISPDGRQVVFRARDKAGKASLFVRRLDSTTVKPLPDTDGALNLSAWSHDSRLLAFFAGAQ